MTIPDRIGAPTALGLDETLFVRVGPRHRQAWSTSIVDVRAGKLLDVVPGRSALEPCRWLEARDDAWLANIEYATLDLSGPYRVVFDTMLPDAVQVADPFHVVKLANHKLDECRRRVQNDTMGHRGRKDDPLYRCRRLLTKADERLDDNGRTKLLGLLAAGDPHGEVRIAWHAKEVVRSIYDHHDPDLAVEFVDRLGRDLQDRSCPIEVRSLGRTLIRWQEPDRGVAPRARDQRADRSREQSDQADQARRVRVHPLPQLPHPRAALRRQAQLGPTRHHHTPLKSEEPLPWFAAPDSPGGQVMEVASLSGSLIGMIFLSCVLSGSQIWPLFFLVPAWALPTGMFPKVPYDLRMEQTAQSVLSRCISRTISRRLNALRCP